MIRPYSTPAQGLLGPPWQGSALSPGIFWNNGPMGGSQWGEGSSQTPVPVCTQLGLGTVELLNWRKIALYLCLCACARPCLQRYTLGLNQLRKPEWQKWSDQHITLCDSKGALHSFLGGKIFLIRSEANKPISLLCLWLNELNKRTDLKGQHSLLLFFLCGGPCHLLWLQTGHLIFLWGPLAYLVVGEKNKYYHLRV